MVDFPSLNFQMPFAYVVVVWMEVVQETILCVDNFRIGFLGLKQSSFLKLKLDVIGIKEESNCDKW